MRMVAPRTGAEEITIAEDQAEYAPLTAAVYQTEDGARILLARWRFSDEDRTRIAAGEDLYIGAMTFGQPLQPPMVQAGTEGWEVPAAAAPEEEAS